MTIKKIFTILLTLVFVISTYTTSFAAPTKNSDIEYVAQTVSSYLPFLEKSSTEMGFINVDFSNVKIGSEINAYKLSTKSIAPIDYQIFPLFSNNRIFAICTLITNEDGTRNVSVSKSYAELIDEITEKFALLFTNNSVYAVLETGASILLQEYPDQGLTTTISLHDAVSVARNYCTQIVAEKAVSYDNASSSRSIAANSLEYNVLSTIEYVPQGNYDICWAACMASVIKHFRGISYTATGLANYLGQSYNSRDFSLIGPWLQTHWGITCAYTTSLLTYNTTVSYIRDNQPLICYLRNSVDSSKGHAVVIRGYYHYTNSSVYSVLYMDPNVGLTMTSLNSSGGFSIAYTSGVYNQERIMSTTY